MRTSNATVKRFCYATLSQYVRTKRRNTLGAVIFNCERYSCPHGQAVLQWRLEQKIKDSKAQTNAC
jgi:hypothetical protein